MADVEHSTVLNAVAGVLSLTGVGTIFVIAVTAVAAMQAQKEMQAKLAKKQQAERDKITAKKILWQSQKNANVSLTMTNAADTASQRRSELHQLDAATREKQSRQGYKPRTLRNRQEDFGNNRARQDKTEDFESVPLLASSNFGHENEIFEPYNFGVENFNTNYFGK